MLYEFGFNFRLIDLTKMLHFVLPVCVYLFSTSLDSRRIRLGLTVIAIVLAMAIAAVTFFIPLYSYVYIKEQISAGNVELVEGEITDFYSPEQSFMGHEGESFSINGINFCYFGTEAFGYATFLCDGGVIYGNGQKVKITYCTNPFTFEKVICSIESLE